MKNIKYYLTLVLRNIKFIGSSKIFWRSFLFAIILWAYISLSDKYQTTIEIPLTIEPPSDRACESVISNSIAVNISANGWQLLKQKFNDMKYCYIKLSDIPLNDDSSYTITSLDMQKNIRNLSTVSYNRFYPDKINIKTSGLFTKVVPIKSKIKVTPAKGFAVVDSIKIHPANVTLKGNDKVISNITEWFTEELHLENVTSSFERQVNLSDYMQSILNVTPSTVYISGTIQPYAEVTFVDIPLQINTNSTILLDNHKIEPRYFSVTLSGGIDVINKLQQENISISINYQDILNDSTGIIKPTVTIPNNTKLLSISPKYVIHNEIIKSNYYAIRKK